MVLRTQVDLGRSLSPLASLASSVFSLPQKIALDRRPATVDATTDGLDAVGVYDNSGVCRTLFLTLTVPGSRSPGGRGTSVPSHGRRTSRASNVRGEREREREEGKEEERKSGARGSAANPETHEIQNQICGKRRSESRGGVGRGRQILEFRHSMAQTCARSPIERRLASSTSVLPNRSFWRSGCEGLR